MPGNLPVPLGVECKIIWAFGGAPYAVNVLHFRNQGATPIDQPRANAIDTLIKAAFSQAGGLASVVHTTVTLVSVHSRDMISNTFPEFVGAGAPVPGTGTGDPLPAATSFVLSERTALRGKSYQGRIYTWGYTELANDTTGSVSAAASTAAQTTFGGILNNMLSQQNLTQCVLSRFTTPAGATAAVERNPPILTTVTALLARDLRWDVQRRRAKPGI